MNRVIEFHHHHHHPQLHHSIRIHRLGSILRGYPSTWSDVRSSFQHRLIIDLLRRSTQKEKKMLMIIHDSPENSLLRFHQYHWFDFDYAVSLLVHHHRHPRRPRVSFRLRLRPLLLTPQAVRLPVFRRRFVSFHWYSTMTPRGKRFPEDDFEISAHISEPKSNDQCHRSASSLRLTHGFSGRFRIEGDQQRMIRIDRLNCLRPWFLHTQRERIDRTTSLDRSVFTLRNSSSSCRGRLWTFFMVSCWSFDSEIREASSLTAFVLLSLSWRIAEKFIADWPRVLLIARR